MALYLVQHGISLTKDQDPEKGLSPAGVKQSKLIAGVAQNYQVTVRRIVHSGLKRALQTAELFQAFLAPDMACEQIDGIRPMDDVIAFANTIDVSQHCLVVGHLPFMERLVSYLTTGNPDMLVYKFQNSGLVCLDADGDNWFIKWTLNPNVD